MLSAVSLLLVGCANYDSDINRIDEELDRIENTRIKSLSEQIDRINVSLPELEQTDKDLKEMIKSLEGTAGDLQKAIAENGTKIEAVNADLAKALDELRSTDAKDKEEAKAFLPDLVKPGAVILAKASRGMAFEELVLEVKRLAKP